MRLMMILATMALVVSACSTSRGTEAAPTTQVEGASSTSESTTSTSTRPDTSTTTTAAAPTTATSASTTTTLSSANCPAAGSTISATITVAGLERDFIVETPPPDSDPAETGSRRPVVLNFHGLGSNGLQQALYSQMSGSALPAGISVVTPDGEGRPRQWLIEGVQTDEPASINFVNALLDELIQNYCIDPERIYATGMSSGGLMSSVLGCVASDRFAAIAPVALTAWDDGLCGDGGPIPITAFHGTADTVISFTGEPTSLVPSGRLGDIRENMESWAEHNGCAPDATETQMSTDVLLVKWECPSGADTLLYVIIEGGHTWPGAISIPTLGYTTKEIDATATIVSFFAGQPGE